MLACHLPLHPLTPYFRTPRCSPVTHTSIHTLHHDRHVQTGLCYPTHQQRQLNSTSTLRRPIGSPTPVDTHPFVSSRFGMLYVRHSGHPGAAALMEQQRRGMLPKGKWARWRTTSRQRRSCHLMFWPCRPREAQARRRWRTTSSPRTSATTPSVEVGPLWPSANELAIGCATARRKHLQSIHAPHSFTHSSTHLRF